MVTNKQGTQVIDDLSIKIVVYKLVSIKITGFLRTTRGQIGPEEIVFCGIPGMLPVGGHYRAGS